MRRVRVPPYYAIRDAYAMPLLMPPCRLMLPAHERYADSAICACYAFTGSDLPSYAAISFTPVDIFLFSPLPHTPALAARLRCRFRRARHLPMLRLRFIVYATCCLRATPLRSLRLL